jgi:glycosyltransferase involved in cell wall biosynthesis
MMCGVPVIASDRGSISEILLSPGGLVVGVAQNFVEAAVEQIEVWLRMPPKFGEASTAAAQEFANLRRHALAECNALLDDICLDSRK